MTLFAILLLIIVVILFFTSITDENQEIRSFYILNQIKQELVQPNKYFTDILSNKVPTNSKIFFLENTGELSFFEYFRNKYEPTKVPGSESYLIKSTPEFDLVMSNEFIEISYPPINSSGVIPLDENTIKLNIIKYLKELGTESNYKPLQDIGVADIYIQYTFLTGGFEPQESSRNDSQMVSVNVFPVYSHNEDRIILSNSFESPFNFLMYKSGDITKFTVKPTFRNYVVKDFMNMPNNISNNIFLVKKIFNLNRAYGSTSFGVNSINFTELYSLDTIYLINSNNEAIPFLVGTFTDSSGLDYRFGFDIVRDLK